MHHWEERYEVLSDNIGGGQGDCFIVSHRESKINYFLKQLRDNTAERRSRFFRETIIFKSLNIDGIPKIFDTNVNEFNHSETSIYYCSELISGKRLDDFVRSQNLEEKLVIDLFTQLLKILYQCHNSDVVHRDIKPENIIIQEDGKLFLVDFGIASYVEENKNITKVGQELGNRFLRLPEYSAGSTSKRDSRSDLTLASGVALYMFTKQYPRKMVDENGCYPHQTQIAMNCISGLKNSILWNIIFDKAFQPNLARRWSQANEILSILVKMTDESNENLEFEKYLSAHAESINFKEHGEIKNYLQNINYEVKKNIYFIINSKAKSFRTEEMNTVYQLGDLEKKCQIRIYPIGQRTFVTANIKASILGEQIIGTAIINDRNIEVCRIKIGDSLTKTEIESMKNIISKELLSELVKLIKK